MKKVTMYRFTMYDLDVLMQPLSGWKIVLERGLEKKNVNVLRGYRVGYYW